MAFSIFKNLLGSYNGRVNLDTLTLPQRFCYCLLTLLYPVSDISNRSIIFLDILRFDQSVHLPLTHIIPTLMRAVLWTVIGTTFTEEQRNLFPGTHQSCVEILCQFIALLMPIMWAILLLIVLNPVFWSLLTGLLLFGTANTRTQLKLLPLAASLLQYGSPWSSSNPYDTNCGCLVYPLMDLRMFIVTTKQLLRMLSILNQHSRRNIIQSPIIEFMKLWQWVPSVSPRKMAKPTSPMFWQSYCLRPSRIFHATDSCINDQGYHMLQIVTLVTSWTYFICGLTSSRFRDRTSCRCLISTMFEGTE